VGGISDLKSKLKKFYFFGAVIIHSFSWSSWLGAVNFDGKICVRLESLFRCFSSFFLCGWFDMGVNLGVLYGLYYLLYPSAFWYSGMCCAGVVPFVFGFVPWCGPSILSVV
jgi:hypothetical protein